MQFKVKSRTWPMIGKKMNVSLIPAVVNGMMREEHAAYCVANKMIVNPGSKPVRLMYGASGPDIVMPLHSFDPTVIVNMDIRPLDVKALIEAIKRQHVKQDHSGFHILHTIQERSNRNFWRREAFLNYGEELIAFELMSLGVPSSSISVDVDQDGTIRVNFPWAYPGMSAKNRELIYTCADITQPNKYPKLFKRRIEGGYFDFYYQKCAMDCMDYADRYLGYLGNHINGAIVISPITQSGKYVESAARVVKILKGKYWYDDRVNQRYSRFLWKTNPFNCYLNLYSWLVELWRRKG